jgi:formylglycine-generating enzyme required for sulfatase activity
MGVPPARVLAPAIVFLGLGIVASCTTFDGLVAGDLPTDGSVGPDAEAADSSLGNETGSELDARAEDTSTADAGPDVYIAPDANFVCPIGPGPSMVKVGTYCIDSTEVTNTHYETFLAQATAATLSTLPLACSFKTSLVPGSWPQPPARANRPVASVDWCDAYAYCKFAGKRLCGTITGGATPVTEYKDASASQWFGACSHAGDGNHAYPYANTYDPAKCNGADRSGDGGLTIDVASANCIGGFPGIFDMSGNVEEWEDSCSAALGRTDDCQVRGGASDDLAAALRCDHNAKFARDYRSSHKGIRCCAP